MDKNYLVTKSNSLITANYDLSLQEQKIILILASMVQPNDEEFMEYKFRVKDILDTLGLQDQSKYIELPKITKELMKKVFEIREGNEILQLAWLSSARYKTKEGILILKFSPDLKPYMLHLKELYTSYKLENILSLKSKYSLRVYELLKCNEFKKKWEIELEELKKILGVTEKAYDLYSNFKMKVILQSQKELKEKTDIRFDFEEIKTGRKVTALRFYIHQNKAIINNRSTALDEISVDVSEDKKQEDNSMSEGIETIINMMKEHNINGSEAMKIYKSANGDMAQISKVYNHFKNKGADNFVALMIKMVKPGEFNEPKKSTKKTSFNNFTPRDYDYDTLEKKLLGWDNEEED